MKRRFSQYKITAQMVRELLSNFPLQPKNIKGFVEGVLDFEDAEDEVWVGFPPGVRACHTDKNTGETYLWSEMLQRHICYDKDQEATILACFHGAPHPLYLGQCGAARCPSKFWDDHGPGEGSPLYYAKALYVPGEEPQIETTVEPYLRKLRLMARSLIYQDLASQAKQVVDILDRWQEINAASSTYPFEPKSPPTEE